jgi:hypothetical protein
MKSMFPVAGTYALLRELSSDLLPYTYKIQTYITIGQQSALAFRFFET